MSDEFHDPVWTASKNGGKIGGCIGWAGGFLLPWGAIALSFIFKIDMDIGALVPFLPLVLAPLGFVVFGLFGMACGALIGALYRKSHSPNEDPPLS